MTDSPAILRPAMKKSQVLIKDIPLDLVEAIEMSAQLRNMSRNDVVEEILARRFRVPFEGSGYPYRPAEPAVDRNIRLAPALLETIRREADERDLPARGLIITTLQIHYDLPTDSPRRRRSESYPALDPEMIREARSRYEAGESLRSLSRRYGVYRETLTRAIRSAV